MTPFSPITLGSVLKTFDTKIAAVTETTHRPFRVLPKHSHRLANLTFVLGGSFTETIGSRSFDCGPKSLLIKPPEETHEDSYGPSGARCLVVELRHEYVSSFLSGEVLDRVDHLKSSSISGLGLRLRKELDVSDNASELMVQGLLLEMVGTVSRTRFASAENRIPRWLKEAKEILEANFLESFDLVRLARSVSIHPVHLVRQFRRSYGLSPGEFVRKLRVEFASSQLANTEQSICDISFAVGFSDHSHFCRVFKLYTGLTPGDYRRSLRR